MTAVELALADAAATERLGARLARALDGSAAVIALQGELGAGKTTLVRALLRALGVTGTIRSPTYTLVEPYEADDRRIVHLDLYRLADAEELEYLGVRDLDAGSALLLIEWPERGAGALPAVDLWVRMAYQGNGRLAALSPGSPRGEAILSGLQKDAKRAGN